MDNDQIRERILKRNQRVAFDKDSHAYTLIDSGQKLRSVSSIRDQFTPTFDAERISRHVARRDGTDPEVVRASWDIRRDYSAIRGDEFHLYVKNFLLHGQHLELTTPVEAEVKSFHKFWQNHKDKYSVVASEFIIYDEELGVAGTVDCLLRTKKGQLVIFDWKTNKKINGKNNFHEKLLPPFDDMDNCELSLFTIQLSLYSYILERTLGLSIAGRFVIHFPKNSDHRVFELGFLKQHLEKIFSENLVK